MDLDSNTLYPVIWSPLLPPSQSLDLGSSCSSHRGLLSSPLPLSDPSWEHPVTVERQGCGILPGCLAKGWRFTKLVVWEESGPWKHGAWVLDSAQPLSRVFDRWENGGEVVTNNYSHPSCSNWLPKVPRPLQFSLFYVFPMRTFFAGVDWIGLLLFIPINTVVLNWVQFCFLEDIWL